MTEPRDYSIICIELEKHIKQTYKMMNANENHAAHAEATKLLALSQELVVSIWSASS